MKQRTIILMAVAMAVALLAAPRVGAGEEKKAAKEAEPPAVARNLAATRTPTPAAPVGNDFRLGVNDVIDVHVWREAELSRVVPVRPDGKISLPLVGELEAEGRTALELRATIAERLKAYVAEPEVTVIVQQINSQRYFVMGEVHAPGAFPLTAPTTVPQALSIAGGFRPFADTGNIHILRTTKDGRTERLKFNYKDWVKRKLTDPMLLQTGDVIVVP